MGQKVRRSQVAVVKNPPANAGDARVRCLGWEDPLVNGMAIHSSILAWRVPWTEEPGGLQSMRSPRVSHTHTHIKGARMPWTEEPGGLQSLGSQRVSQTDSERQTPSPPKEHARTHTQRSPKLAFLCFCFSWWLLGADAPKERSREARRTRYYESVREKGFLFRLLGGAGPDRLPGRPSPEATLAQGSRQEQSL